MASPSISLLGATYPDVSGVTLPKQGGGTATFPWVEGSETKTQNGTYDVTNLAQLIVNVAGGGGGLTYETGIFEPESNIARATVYFSTSHSTRPIMIIMSDIGDDAPSNGSAMWWTMSNWYDYTGKATIVTSSSSHYGRVNYGYRSSSGSEGANGNTITALTGTTNSSLSNWVDNTCFRPYTASTSRYWRAGRKYKWIAVWAPTT